MRYRIIHMRGAAYGARRMRGGSSVRVLTGRGGWLIGGFVKPRNAFSSALTRRPFNLPSRP